jgi:protein required for attachment to host cells
MRNENLHSGASSMLTVDWILVADRSRAVVLHALPHGIRPYPTLANFVHAEGRQRPHDRDSDVSGRIQHPGGARSTIEPHEDRWHVEARRFAKVLTEALDRDRLNGRFDRLFVVAPPAFLGVLRETWPGALRDHIAAEFAEDLLPLPEPELQSRLSGIVSANRSETSGA